MSNREIEAKIALVMGEPEAIRSRLVALGASKGAVDEEENLLFDADDHRIRIAGQVVRIRRIAGRASARLTFKGPVDSRARFKSREELEVDVSDAGRAQAILERLGLHPMAAYRKRREHWTLGSAAIALDEVAAGHFIEVEAEEAVIEDTLRLLGLARRPHVAAGYASLIEASGSTENRE